MAADKNEIMFSRLGINYSNEAEQFRKGSVVYRHVSLPCSLPILKANELAWQ